MKRLFTSLFLLLFCFNAYAGSIEKNSKIYITPMDGSLNTYITGEIIKRKLPITVTMDSKKADYVLLGTMTSKGNRWHDTAKDIALLAMAIPSMRDKNQASVMLMNPKDKSILWASNTGDRRLFLSLFARKGQGKLAKKIVKQMKKDLF